MGVKMTPARARALESAARGELRRWDRTPGRPASGKTYAVGRGTVQKATIGALRGSQPPLLADGEQGDRFVTLVLTAAGRAALAEYRSDPAKQHVGKARPR